MMHCPHCRSGDIAFDLAADEQIFLSFWVCPDCGQRGVTRIVDRRPPSVEAPPAPRPVHSRSVRLSSLPGRRGRRERRRGQTRA